MNYVHCYIGLPSLSRTHWRGKQFILGLLSQPVRHGLAGWHGSLVADEIKRRTTAQTDPSLPVLLSKILETQPQITPRIARKYFEVLASLARKVKSSGESRQLLLESVRIALADHKDLPNNQPLLLDTYSSFALGFLTSPHLSDNLGGFDQLATYVDAKMLSNAIAKPETSRAVFSLESNLRLWLLAHYIRLQRLQRGRNHDPSFVRAISTLLSSSSSDIVDRIGADDDAKPGDDDIDDQPVVTPLPHFVKAEVVTLVNRESIVELLDKFDQDYISPSDGPVLVDDDASLLASYALTLLRIFPTLGDEIRMWLYQGSARGSERKGRLPAVKLFWQVMSQTETFTAIAADSKLAISLLRPYEQPLSAAMGQQDLRRARDWQSILLFLELYAFVLKFTDDEEFLSGGSVSVYEADKPVSRSRASALPLDSVKVLTMFLKNLSFTMYFNASELIGESQHSNPGGLGAYFDATSTANADNKNRPVLQENGERKSDDQRGFLGVAGMSFTNVRGIVTRVMGMLYERDSRRRFLPKDHWLMTSHFDMERFIPAVVAEEERRHQASEGAEDEEEEEEYAAPAARLGRQGHLSRLQIREKLQQQQMKAQRKKMLASIAPRLEVLQNMPFVIPFDTRVRIFHQFIYQDQVRRRNGNVDPDEWRMSIMHGDYGGVPRRQARAELLSRHRAKIRRDQIFEDAYEQYYGLGDGLKEPIQIEFVDQFGTTEAGVDGGGVTKEFLTSVTNEAFHAADGARFFVTNDQNLLYPNPAALDESKELLRASGLDESSPEWRDNLSELLRHYAFLGRIIGKCLYEGILVDISFAGFFLLKWASKNTNPESGYVGNINDLRDLDESLYQGLLQLKNYPGDVRDFALDFTINDTVSMPGEPTRTITRNLVPNGQNIPVTNENRVLYISAVARHRLHLQPLHQTRAFLRGLWDMINPSWLSMFNQAELQKLIGGDSTEIDVDDLRRNTHYSGLYEIGDDGEEAPTIKIFWSVMKKLDDSERRKVLKYVTSTPRAPLLGFSQLNPNFSIRDSGNDQQRLPSTSTCINLLKLPRYTSEAVLRERLLYAINSGAGFDLS